LEKFYVLMMRNGRAKRSDSSGPMLTSERARSWYDAGGYAPGGGAGGWLFATPAGGPLNPRTDWTEGKRLLNRAGVRDVRLHDARHTAATVLLLLGVPERAVMGVMGWSNTAMAARYQHLTSAVQRDIANRVGGLIWQVSDDTATDK
jgi:integrase